MTDRDEIRDLCFTYTFHLDDGEFDEVGELLRHAVLRPTMAGVVGDDIVGADAVAEFYRDQVVTYSRGRPMTRHLITNQIISIDRDGLKAASRSYFTVLQRAPGLDFHVVVGGRYNDEFEKVDGSWRFTLKDIVVDHLNDIENHFRISEAKRR